MHLSALDLTLWLAGIAGEVLLVSILFVRRDYRNFPVFFTWVLFVLALEPTFYWLNLHASPTAYYKTFFALNFPQYLLELGVLAEIGLNVIRPVSKSVHRKLLLALATATLVIAALGFILAASLNASTLADPRSFMVIDTTMAILRLAIFVLIAGFSQLLGLNWKNHVLQLASGLAFYAVITLIVDFAQSYLRASPSYANQFFALDHLRIGGYLCALYFWCYAFAKKEAPRKDFSPQMTRFLVSMSSTTQRQRAVLARTRDQ